MNLTKRREQNFRCCMTAEGDLEPGTEGGFWFDVAALPKIQYACMYFFHSHYCWLLFAGMPHSLQNARTVYAQKAGPNSS